MNQLAIMFYDPNFGITIEEALEENDIIYAIEKTPISLLEIDPLYCKTFILADTNNESLNQLRKTTQLTIAAVYITTNGRYEVMNEVL